MVGTTYDVTLRLYSEHTAIPYVSARTATAFTITHDNNSTAQVGWEAIGQGKPTR
jgi:hypothetical protein